MADILVRSATKDDIEYVAGHLRRADAQEVKVAQPGEDAVLAIQESAAGSLWCKSVIVDGAPCVLYGLGEESGAGVPWMLATADIRKIKNEFLAGSAPVITRMREQFSFLANQVHRDNATSINWLRRLGFTVGSIPVGNGGEFFNFWIGEKND